MMRQRSTQPAPQRSPKLRQGKYGTRHLTADNVVEMLPDKPKRAAKKVRRVKR